VDTRPVKDTTPFEGKTSNSRSSSSTASANNVVVSRRRWSRPAWRGARQAAREPQGRRDCQGHGQDITDYGAFVDLGGIDGLLHITDLAWRRVRHPSEVVQVGQELTAKVLKFDQEKNRVSLA